MFKALVLEKNPDFGAAVREVGDDFLPDGDVTIDVDYSTLNYKDGLAITNRSPVVRLADGRGHRWRGYGCGQHERIVADG